MPIAAGLLNQKAAFQRRAPLPTTPGGLRGGFEAYGAQVWAAYTERRPRDLTISGLTMTARTATLAIRESAWAHSISRADRVAIDGDVFDVTANALVDRRDGVLRFELVEAVTTAMYEREVEARGEVILIRRASVPDRPVRAWVTGYEPHELVGGVQQGDRRVVALASDFGDFPVPLKAGADATIIRSGKMTMQAVDDSTHRIAGELIAYELRVRG